MVDYKLAVPFQFIIIIQVKLEIVLYQMFHFILINTDSNGSSTHIAHTYTLFDSLRYVSDRRVNMSPVTHSKVGD